MLRVGSPMQAIGRRINPYEYRCRRRVVDKKPLSKDDRRHKLIQYMLMQLAQGRWEYADVPVDPQQRISIDSNTDLLISIGLSTNVHSLCARPTGDSHIRTTDDPAQRFRGQRESRAREGRSRNARPREL